MHKLSARILGGGHDVRMIYAFDPQVLLYCFNEVFSELREFKRVNIAWNGWDKNKWRSIAGKIEIDADHPRNRGPVFEQGFMWFIRATIEPKGTATYTFDPTVILDHLRIAFPEIEVDGEDKVWRPYDLFINKLGLTDDDVAVRMALNDAARRGPMWNFYFRFPDSEEITGLVERRKIQLASNTPILEPLRSQFIQFLKDLPLTEEVQISAVRLAEKREFPLSLD